MRCINGFTRWLVCFRMMCNAVGLTMRSNCRHRLIVGSILESKCNWIRNGRSNASRLQDIWSMMTIAMIEGMMTPHGRSPTSTPQSSMIAARSELEGCFVYVVCWNAVCE
jgi:hypothetical protein